MLDFQRDGLTLFALELLSMLVPFEGEIKGCPQIGIDLMEEGRDWQCEYLEMLPHLFADWSRAWSLMIVNIARLAFFSLETAKSELSQAERQF